MILTTSYLFSHLSPDSKTLFITPYTPPSKRNPEELIPIEISKIAYFVRHPSFAPDSPSSTPSTPHETTCYYLGRNSDSSFCSFKFILDSDSPKLPLELDHLVVKVDDKLKRRKIDLVFNPKSGHGYSSALLNDVVKPLLKPFEEFGLFNLRVWETKEKNDGERIGREIAIEDEEEDRTVIVLGGDGTVHEILNGAVLKGGKVQGGESELDLALIPTGTANAMYYHLFPPESHDFPQSAALSPFYSFVSFLRRSTSPLPLPLALNTIERPSSSTLPPVSPTLTSVVTSAALHACLLHDAEELRDSHPGVERFKIAAQENVKNWWNGTLKLGGDNGTKRYRSQSKTFEEDKDGAAELEGPFAYWISSLVSRFEPTFVVAPLRSPQHELAPSSANGDAATIDLVVIRPLRHRETKEIWEKGGDEQSTRESFAAKVWEVTGGMYQGGKHVDMLYAKGDGVDDTEEEARTEIVEVWRVNEFVWTPVPSSNLKSNLVCFDGALHDLGEGGSLKTKILGSDETEVRVWR